MCMLHLGRIIVFRLDEAVVILRPRKMSCVLVRFPPLHSMYPTRKSKQMGLQPPVVLADAGKSAGSYCMQH